MIRQIFIQAACLICAFVGTAMAYPSGAPAMACDTMTPGHGSERSAANPYSLTTSVSEYNPGDDLTGEKLLHNRFVNHFSIKQFNIE